MPQSDIKTTPWEEFVGSYWFELGYQHAKRGLGFPALYEKRMCKQFRYEAGRQLAAINPNLNMNNPSKYEINDTINALQSAMANKEIL